MKTEGIEGSERIGNYKRLVVGGNVKNPSKSKESSPLPLFRTFKISAKIETMPRFNKDRFDLALCWNEDYDTALPRANLPYKSKLD